jgi:hypothetical protein
MVWMGLVSAPLKTQNPYTFKKFWGYVAVCVQLYCRWFAVLRLVVAVLHYMFRLTWPSSSVYDVILLYSWRNLLRCFVALSCTWLYYARFHLCFSVSFLILVCVFACLPFLVVCRNVRQRTIYNKAARRRRHNLKTYWTMQCSRMLQYSIINPYMCQGSGYGANMTLMTQMRALVATSFLPFGHKWNLHSEICWQCIVVTFKLHSGK